MDDIHEEVLDADDCRLYRIQQGRGVPLVLVHGGPGATHHSFRVTFPSDKEFATLIYYDQHGQGDADYEPGAVYTVGQAASNLDNLRQALRIERWIVLGDGYGWLLAQVYAVKYPNHMAGLVLVCPTPAIPSSITDARPCPLLTAAEQERIDSISKMPITLSWEMTYAHRVSVKIYFLSSVGGALDS
ncbi:MAG: alpha/beta fold hydrolase [Phycisphaerales bacterium]|nr:alpha/beta fold hydrolase [Phycisphaerales bacterium]